MADKADVKLKLAILQKKNSKARSSSYRYILFLAKILILFQNNIIEYFDKDVRFMFSKLIHNFTFVK